jgi:hypothetical protein
VNNKTIYFYGEEMVGFSKWFMYEPGASFVKYCKPVSRSVPLSLYCELYHNVVTILIEYQLLIMEINFSPTKDKFLDNISVVVLTRCRGEYLDLRREIRVTVRARITLRLAAYGQSVRLGAKPLETHDQYIFSTDYLRL